MAIKGAAFTSKLGVSLGILRNVVSFPDEALPEWANTYARRIQQASPSIGLSTIKQHIEQMEIARRKKVRESLPGTTPITEFDIYLAGLLLKFTNPKAGK
jgi:hypothetical protein